MGITIPQKFTFQKKKGSKSIQQKKKRGGRVGKTNLTPKKPEPQTQPLQFYEG